MNWQLVNYNGRLAITLPWSTAYNGNPEEARALWVHPTEKWSEYYERFTQIELRENDYFSCFDNTTYQTKPLYTGGWEQVCETRPVRPPSRGGRDWHWRWSEFSGEYVKEWN